MFKTIQNNFPVIYINFECRAQRSFLNNFNPWGGTHMAPGYLSFYPERSLGHHQRKNGYGGYGHESEAKSHDSETKSNDFEAKSHDSEAKSHDSLFPHFFYHILRIVQGSFSTIRCLHIVYTLFTYVYHLLRFVQGSFSTIRCLHSFFIRIFNSLLFLYFAIYCFCYLNFTFVFYVIVSIN